MHNHILIIEDDPGISELLSEQLEEMGFQSSVQSTGQAAIEHLRTHQPLIMVLDFSLPDMNGMEFIHDAGNSDLTIPPYIVCTGRGDERIAVEMMKLGARDYLVKDSDFLERIPTVLSRVIEEVKNKKKLEEAERTLNRTFTLFEAVIKQSPMGQAIIAPDGTIEVFNEACAEILGIGSNKTIAPGANMSTIHRTWQEYYPDGTPAELEDLPFFRALKGDTTSNLELFIVRHDGTQRWMLMNGMPVYDAQDELVAVYISFADISEKRLMEEKLTQAEKMQAIGQLAGGIAHDFNNQLGGIVGYADILKVELEDNPTLSSYVDNILLSASRAANLTGQLLAFARKNKFISSRINLNDIVTEVIGILNHTIDKRISVLKELSDKPCITRGDPTHIQNMIVNLGLNARDAMPRGGKLTFTTGTQNLDENFCNESAFKIAPGDYIRITCEDTGTGIEKELLKKIFEPFFTTKEQGKGTGMGLAAVYGTVKAHKGAIVLESQPGAGSTFSVFLPADTGNDEK